MNVGRLAALAGASAVLAAVVLPAPFAAAAGGPGDRLYVDRSVVCSDSGPATPAQPLCTISAAARIVQPGQTVVVSGVPHYQESVLITRSGAPGKPITFTTGTMGDPRNRGFGSFVETTGTPAFTIKGATDVVIHGFVAQSDVSTVVVADSARVTVDHVYAAKSLGGEPAIRVAGTSDRVTVSRSAVYGDHSAGIQVDAGTHGTVVSTNYIAGLDYNAIVVNAAGTVVTSNTVIGTCGPGILLNDGATGSVIRNNVISAHSSLCPPPGKPGAAIQVATGASTGTDLDYNLIQTGAEQAPYLWNGRTHADPAQLNAATGQGAHDLIGDPLLFGDEGLDRGSPGIDSGDAAAPGILPTDFYGYPEADDPSAANTGTGRGIRDRGAMERQSVIRQSVEVTGERGPYPRPVTARASVQQNWPVGALSYSFDFGDGTAPTVTTQPTADHTYARAGTFAPTVTVTNSEGVAYPGSSRFPFVVTEPGAPTAAFTVKQCSIQYSCGPIGYEFDTSPSTTAWPLDKGRIDFGDGSGQDLTSLSKDIRHNYPHPGEYTVTFSFTNRNGEQAGTSQRLTVSTKPVGLNGYGAQRALDTRHPGGSKLTPGQKLSIDLRDEHWPVSWDATAVVLNVTAVNAEGPGFLTLGPNDRPRPGSSSLNYVPGAAVPNLVTVPIGNDSKLAVWNSYGAPVDLVIDIQGEYDPRATDLYAPLQPKRIMDSRSGIGVPAGKISSACTAASTRPVTKLKVRGVNGVPNDATNVVLNVTVTEPDMDGNLMVDNTAATNTSNLNFKAGQTTSNQVIARIASDGTITFCNNAGALHIIADVFGYYGPSGQHLFVATDPTRLLDSRVSPGKLAPYSRATVRGLPADASGAVLNVTATEPTADGFLAVYPGGTDRPDVSTVNFAAGQTVATHATVPVGGDGTISLYNHNGGTHAVVDSSGYFVHK
ncbi:PKD domain-containing protein [Kitasatospora sp. NPDC056651]|uniref:PKD domain-containing protein n=1 Tax=Kitasatospora sp. NPDC056651 TaxID=3345892 RepID=UPI0036CDA333